MNFERIGVIGAGTMGCGLTVTLVLHQKHVVLIDKYAEVLGNAKKNILRDVQLATLFNLDFPKMTKEEVLEKITFTTQLSDVKECDFIIENITENIVDKEMVYRELDKICDLSVCFAANTSCISITGLASFTKRSDRVVGMHLMNPVYAISTVEVVRGHHTSNQSLDAVDGFLKSIKKDAIVVEDFPGFVSNRISHLYMNEAAFVVQDGIASAEQVDQIFTKCYGHKTGPLRTADLIGLDTVVDSLSVLYNSYQDTKFRCCPLLKKMVAAGYLGIKSGQGFYQYV